MITPIFVFAFQLGDGDISYVDQNGLDHLLEDEKILGVETHSLSKIDSWKKLYLPFDAEMKPTDCRIC